MTRGLCRRCGATNVKRNGKGLCNLCAEPGELPGYEKQEEPDDYATAKARQLIADEFRRNGQEGFAKQYEHGGFTTNPLRAFARYIGQVE